MTLTEAKYYVRPILWIAAYILLCIGGAFFVYLILMERIFGYGDFFSHHLEVWVMGATIIVIGFIGLLLVFKLLDYSRDRPGSTPGKQF